MWSEAWGRRTVERNRQLLPGGVQLARATDLDDLLGVDRREVYRSVTKVDLTLGVVDGKGTVLVLSVVTSVGGSNSEAVCEGRAIRECAERAPREGGMS